MSRELKMANRHCIENILQKQDHHVSSSRRTEDNWKEEDHEKRSTIHRALLLPVPQDHPRSLLSDSHRTVPPLWYRGVSRCCCPNCVQESSSSWLPSSPPALLSSADKIRNRCTSKCFHTIRYEKDFRPIGASSLATKSKQQLSPNVAGVAKRKKRHRTAFTPTQLLGLENAFEQSHYSVGDERKKLGAFLGLSETQIKVWFQNRRTKWKRLRREAEEEESYEEDAGENNAEIYAHHASYYPRCTADSIIQRQILSYPIERNWSLHSWSRDDRVHYR